MCQLSLLLVLASVSVLAVATNIVIPVAGNYPFLFLPTPHNWANASEICYANQAHLAYPNTHEEALALWDIMTTYDVDQVNIGFHDQYIEGKFYTVKGRLVSDAGFNQWAPDGTTGGIDTNCGSLQRDGMMNVDCSILLPSICVKNDPDQEGYKDYDLIPNHGFYKMLPTRLNWTEGLEACYEDGAHMLILNSEEEHAAVFAKYPEVDGVILTYVGVHHYYKNRYFVTIFDEHLNATGYSRWAVNQPTGTNLVYPVLQVGTSGYLTWSSYDKRRIICEYTPV